MNDTKKYTYKLILTYKGTNYSGWQNQTTNPQTVQNQVEKVVEKDYDEDYASQNGFHNKQMINKRSRSLISLVKGGKQLGTGNNSLESYRSSSSNNKTKL